MFTVCKGRSDPTLLLRCHGLSHHCSAGEEADDEGGIMIPELASKKSAPSSGLRQLLLAEASRPFKIMQGPLLRCTLIRVPLLHSSLHSSLCTDPLS